MLCNVTSSAMPYTGPYPLITYVPPYPRVPYAGPYPVISHEQGVSCSQSDDYNAHHGKSSVGGDKGLFERIVSLMEAGSKCFSSLLSVAGWRANSEIGVIGCIELQSINSEGESGWIIIHSIMENNKLPQSFLASFSSDYYKNAISECLVSGLNTATLAIGKVGQVTYGVMSNAVTNGTQLSGRAITVVLQAAENNRPALQAALYSAMTNGAQLSGRAVTVVLQAAENNRPALQTAFYSAMTNGVQLSGQAITVALRAAENNRPALQAALYSAVTNGTQLTQRAVASALQAVTNNRLTVGYSAPNVEELPLSPAQDPAQEDIQASDPVAGVNPLDSGDKSKAQGADSRTFSERFFARINNGISYVSNAGRSAYEAISAAVEYGKRLSARAISRFVEGVVYVKSVLSGAFSRAA